MDIHFYSVLDRSRERIRDLDHICLIRQLLLTRIRCKSEQVIKLIRLVSNSCTWLIQGGASYRGTGPFPWTVQLLFQLPHTVIILWVLPPFLEFLDQRSPQMLFNFFGFVRYFIIALFQIVNSAWSRTGRKEATIFFKIIFGNQGGQGAFFSINIPVTPFLTGFPVFSSSTCRLIEWGADTCICC